MNKLKVYFLFVFSISSIRSHLIFPKDETKYHGCECENSYGFPGTCKQVAECPSDHQFLRRNDLCSFSTNAPLYCCPNTIEGIVLNPIKSEISNNTALNPVLGYKEVIRPIIEICQSYLSMANMGDKIFGGGRKSLLGEQAHMAAIGWSKANGEIDWRCGGSLVMANMILTAAHCTSLRGKNPDVVRTGDLNLMVTENNTHPTDHKITDVYVHPNYTGQDLYHDIALLKISPDFRITDTALPACIWSYFTIPVENLTAMGFGTRSFGGPQSNELYQGQLSYQQHEDCVKNIPANSDVPKGIMPGQMCAYSPNADTCQADSGGPLLFTMDFMHYIVGITSFGINCLGNKPGVYTRTSEYVDWIESILLPNFRSEKLN